MSAKAIREGTGKDILNRLLDSSSGAARCQFASVSSDTNWDELLASHPWLKSTVSEDLSSLSISHRLSSSICYFCTLITKY